MDFLPICLRANYNLGKLQILYNLVPLGLQDSDFHLYLGYTTILTLHFVSKQAFCWTVEAVLDRFYYSSFGIQNN